MRQKAWDVRIQNKTHAPSVLVYAFSTPGRISCSPRSEFVSRPISVRLILHSTYFRDNMPDCIGIVLNLLHELLRKVRGVLAYVNRNHVLENGSREANAVQTPDEARTTNERRISLSRSTQR